MAKKASSKPNPKRPTRISSGSFWGRKIEIMSHHDSQSMMIDGVPIHFVQDEDGVLSHQHFMYQKFSNPYELAEALIRQWGSLETKIFHKKAHK